MVRQKTISIRDVAYQAGVSPATVSNVLNGRAASSTEEVAARVRAIAVTLGYKPDRVARQLRTGKARVITILVPSLDNPYFTAIIAAFERQVQDEDYDIIVASSNESEATEHSRLTALLSWRPSGVVIIPNDDRFTSRSVLEDYAIPYVVVDRIATGFAGDAIGSDNYSGGRQAASHLLEYGHASALVVASSTRIANIRERCEGIAEVFLKAGLAAPQVLEVGQTFEDVAEGLRRWLVDNTPPTAVIALTNFATLGILADLTRRQVRVPEDISLVGFDDYAWMRAAAPPITAVRQEIERTAAEAWSAIRRRIGDLTSPAQHIRLPCELIVRNSTRRVGLPFGRGSIETNTPNNMRDLPRNTEST